MSKIELAMDLDGVAYDFMSAWNVLAVRHGIIEPDQMNVSPGDWSFYRGMGLAGAEFAQSLTDLSAEGLYEIAPPDPEMQRTWRRLYASDNFHFHVITSRPEVAEASTKHWLAKHDLPYDAIDVVHEGAKPDFLTGSMPVIAVDDGDHNILDYEAAGHLAIIYNQPWNQTSHGPRACSPSDMARAIRSARVAERLR